MKELLNYELFEEWVVEIKATTFIFNSHLN